MSALTSNEAKLMRFIQRYKARTERTPSFEEMAEELGSASKSNAHRIVSSLIRAGHLARERMKGSARGLVILKAIPDDRFATAARATLDATGLPYSEAQLKAGREALIDVLVLDAAEEVAA